MHDGRRVYVFRSESGRWSAVSAENDARSLPGIAPDVWAFISSFELSVSQPTPLGRSPEPILRGLVARGHFVWDHKEVPQPAGTSQ